MSAPEDPAVLPALVRARDLRALGLTRTDADYVMRKAGCRVQFGRSVYAKREDVERVMEQHEFRWDVAS